MMIEVEVNEFTKIARYLDLPRFLDIIHNNRLYFRQVDKYDDILEGCYPRQLYDLAQCITVTGPDGVQSNNGMVENTKVRRKSSYVSCWTLSEYENMGLWNVYGGRNSVAIETTVGILDGELNASIETARFIEICSNSKRYSGVRYIDHHNEDLNRIDPEFIRDPILCKNIGYSYEQEVRFVYSTALLDGAGERLYRDGFYIGVNVLNLFNNIYISPNAEPWFSDLVKVILANSASGLADLVTPSKLGIIPYVEAENK
jgi:hypothetical protein